MTTRVFSLSDCTYPHIINQAKSHTKVVFNSSQSRDFQSRHEHVLSGDVCSICKKERKKERNGADVEEKISQIKSSHSAGV